MLISRDKPLVPQLLGFLHRIHFYNWIHTEALQFKLRVQQQGYNLGTEPATFSSLSLILHCCPYSRALFSYHFSSTAVQTACSEYCQDKKPVWAP